MGRNIPAGSNVSKACAASTFQPAKTASTAVNTAELDTGEGFYTPVEYDVCINETWKFCSDVQREGITAMEVCLLSHISQANPACRRRLYEFIPQVSNFELSPIIHKACGSQEHVCPTSSLRGRDQRELVRCWLLHLDNPKFARTCQEALVKEHDMLAHNFDLTPIISSICAHALERFRASRSCSQRERGLVCLLRNTKSIRSELCRHSVLVFSQVYAPDLEAADLEDACRPEIRRLCGKTGTSWGRWKFCLMKERKQITRQRCREAVMSHEVFQDEQEHVDAKVACAAEYRTFCLDSVVGRWQNVQKCFNMHTFDVRFSSECREAMERLRFKLEERWEKAQQKRWFVPGGMPGALLLMLACMLPFAWCRRQARSAEREPEVFDTPIPDRAG